MGFPPFPAPVSLETAIPCPPVALFGAHCAMSLEAAVSLAGFTFCAPTIDLAHSSWQLRLHFGVCCSSGSGFICNESSNIETVEGVPTTNSQSETSRRKQCESVPPGMKRPSRNKIAVSFGLCLSSVSKRLMVKVSSDIAYLTFPWGCHLWPCLLFLLGFFFRSSRLAVEHLNWMAPGALS